MPPALADAPPTRPRDRKERRALLAATITARRFRRLSALELGRQARRWRAEGWILEEIAEVFGCSFQQVRIALALVESAHPSVVAAVESGVLTPTTAYDLVEAEPDPGRQAALLAEARQTSTGKRLRPRPVTARHFSIPLGKKRLLAAKDSVGKLERLLLALPESGDSAEDTSLERRATARAVLRFLQGGRDAESLRRFLLQDREP